MHRILVIVCGIGLMNCSKNVTKDDEEKESSTAFLPFRALKIINDATPASLSSGIPVAADPTLSRLKTLMYSASAKDSIPLIVGDFDRAIDVINTRFASLSGTPSCMNQEAVRRTILTPDFQPFTVYLQCYDEYSYNSFSIWGKDPENNVYLFSRSPSSISLAKITLQDNTYSKLDAYFSSSYLDGDNSSGTVLRIIADQTAKFVQVSAAAPHEICGYNMFADQTQIHLRSSISTTTSEACPAEYDSSYLVTDLSSSTGFDVSKLLGRDSSFRRKAGTKLVNGVATPYEEYANTSGDGNVSLVEQSMPHSNGADINFGPSIANDLGGTKIE